MTALPLAQRLLQDGIPLTLLMDLLDPEGMKLALAAELTPSDVARTPSPAPRRAARTA
ncbi:MAG: hypothetical protein JWO27_2432 [Frankiales bacterium]|jgi:hypothetical protein|nr:hypothetical protein [Frankiales bacterium]MCW2709511.1 hypothetical protein [Frankiales bacterium]